MVLLLIVFTYAGGSCCACVRLWFIVVLLGLHFAWYLPVFEFSVGLVLVILFGGFNYIWYFSDCSFVHLRLYFVWLCDCLVVYLVLLDFYCVCIYSWTSVVFNVRLIIDVIRCLIGSRFLWLVLMFLLICRFTLLVGCLIEVYVYVWFA